jgi:hypothetical protein
MVATNERVENPPNPPLKGQGCFILFFCRFQTLEIAGVLRLFSYESVKSEEICAIAPTHKGFRQSLPILPPRMKQPCFERGALVDRYVAPVDRNGITL